MPCCTGSIGSPEYQGLGTGSNLFPIIHSYLDAGLIGMANTGSAGLKQRLATSKQAVKHLLVLRSSSYVDESRLTISALLGRHEIVLVPPSASWVEPEPVAAARGPVEAEAEDAHAGVARAWTQGHGGLQNQEYFLIMFNKNGSASLTCRHLCSDLEGSRESRSA